MRQALAERMAKFALELHPDKTWVLGFGRYARKERERKGLPKPETFTFLGFVHIAGTSRKGTFQLQRQTSGKKLRASLARIKEACRRRRHLPVADQHAWLRRVVIGHVNYYGVPSNYRALGTFHGEVSRIWHRSLQRRSQRGRWREDSGHASSNASLSRLPASSIPGPT